MNEEVPLEESLQGQDVAKLNPSLEQILPVDTSEVDKVPSWFKGVVKKITDAWFDPKSFEQNPTIYEKLGVRTFKRYMPTGDLVIKYMKKREFAEKSLYFWQ